jgi:hypothetical protein
MDNQQPTPKRSWRPRLSLLSALLLITIIGMAIVIAQLWHEVGPLRKEVRDLRNEVGRLSIDDPTKVHAIEVRTNEQHSWKWRVWVPENEKVSFHTKWGNVPRTGVPANCPPAPLAPGEQWITMRVMQDQQSKEWFAQYETNGSGFGLRIKNEDCWWNWSKDAMMAEGVQNQSVAQLDPKEPLILTRYRTVPSGNSDDLRVDAPTPGFIIWLERR